MMNTFTTHLNIPAQTYLDALITEWVLNKEFSIRSFQHETHMESMENVVDKIIEIKPNPFRILQTTIWSALIIYDDMCISITGNRGYASQGYSSNEMDETNPAYFLYTINALGDEQNVNAIKDKLKDLKKKIYPKVEWWYKDAEEGGLGVRHIQMRSANDTPTEFYPWFKGEINTHLNNFLEGNSNILMMFGPPGTGKTSLLKNFIVKNSLTAIIAYEDVMMDTDEMFMAFLGRPGKVLLLVEDADLLISPRTDGNKLIARFLNMADGLISSKDKKIIFTSNVANYHNIDDALLRPGRCYDVIEFQYLTQGEANNIATKIGKALPEGKKHYTLAEIFNQEPMSFKPEGIALGIH